ncbi:hypothetical protein EJ06DRAFT_581531 [Trichodelitschia bisporula]|uniref:Uncharacterized protein n=1 Tax=Trichodelitschia bisporula TaxID=703511 RepID=A0A6G1HZD5_9PEZI|nr:hypothetical protein EJ06DRAFT_581531 [Trichodelitschia bisporula]
MPVSWGREGSSRRRPIGGQAGKRPQLRPSGGLQINSRSTSVQIAYFIWTGFICCPFSKPGSLPPGRPAVVVVVVVVFTNSARSLPADVQPTPFHSFTVPISQSLPVPRFVMLHSTALLSLLALSSPALAFFPSSNTGPLVMPHCWRKCAREAGLMCHWNDVACLCKAANAGLLTPAATCACNTCSNLEFGNDDYARMQLRSLSSACKGVGTPFEQSAAASAMQASTCDAPPPPPAPKVPAPASAPEVPLVPVPVPSSQPAPKPVTTSISRPAPAPAPSSASWPALTASQVTQPAAWSSASSSARPAWSSSSSSFAEEDDLSIVVSESTAWVSPSPLPTKAGSSTSAAKTTTVSSTSTRRVFTGAAQTAAPARMVAVLGIAGVLAYGVV